MCYQQDWELALYSNPCFSVISRVNTLTRLTCNSLDCVFVLLTKVGVSVFTVTFVLAVLLSFFLRVVNQVGSYRYCEYANVANV